MKHFSADDRLRLLAALLLMALLATPTGCRFPGSVRPTIKIGLVAPFEGRHRAVGYDVFYAVRLALREANEAGGVSGRYVELIAYDDGGDPALAAQQARKLAVDPDVVAAIGHFRADATAAALPIYAESGIPLLAPASGGWTVDRSRASAHRLAPPAARVADALLNHLLDGTVRAPALLQDGSALAAALEGAAAARGVSFVVLLPAATPEHRLLAAQPDAIVCVADAVPCAEALSALHAGGWRGRFVGGPSLASGDFAAIAGEAVALATFVTPFPYATDVNAEDFAAAYRRVSRGADPGHLALPAYEATWRVLNALASDLEMERTPSRAAVAAALDALAQEGMLDDRQASTLFIYGFADGGAPRLLP